MKYNSTNEAMEQRVGKDIYIFSVVYRDENGEVENDAAVYDDGTEALQDAANLYRAYTDDEAMHYTYLIKRYTVTEDMDLVFDRVCATVGGDAK